MRVLTVFILFLSTSCFAQSLDGEGTANRVQTIPFDPATIQTNYRSTIEEERPKYKRGELHALYQWVDFTNENGESRRLIRDYNAELFYYREELVPFVLRENMSCKYSVVRELSNKIETLDEEDFVYHGKQEVYQNGFLFATLFFDNGRPTRILLNHYFSNNQLQFVREITSLGVGEPLRNTGVLESYYPDGRRFENPLSEDESAIVILDDNGIPTDECACMGQDIMEWGPQFLYSFMGKYFYLLETIYANEGM